MNKVENKNILLVYPDYPDTFWSYRHALKFIAKKTIYPPLGLLTIASMLPDDWEKKFVNLNIKKLKDEDIEWADFVFISAMMVQKKSAEKIIKRCNDKGVKVVAGGPLFTALYNDFNNVDYFVLNEAEITLPQFLNDLKNKSLKKFYTTTEFPDLSNTPVPLWSLINVKDYVSMNIQYSRGCPFNCEFCDVTTLFGRRIRTKSKEQILAELDKMYSVGWRGGVFFVDDNFIGNKMKLKSEILPAIIQWQEERETPFIFNTEASINLADDDELMKMMSKAGFNSVFVGIETPDENSLAECNKFQNIGRDLVESVKKIQKFGMEVTGGFIVGFDNDKPSIFERQIKFIKETGIITAMVGLLNAPRNTGLYLRLEKENRLLNNNYGDNTDPEHSLNFIPKMDYTTLITGYKKIIEGIYSCKPYYERVLQYLKRIKNQTRKNFKIKFSFIKLTAFFKSILILGIKNKGRRYYWKLFFWSLFNRPSLIPVAITYSIYGYHFRKVYKL